jgi:uncharacterized protein
VATLSQLSGEQFVSLTTFRRNGEGVPTPVWCAPDGDGLVVTTMASTGKVKRVRRTPRVTVRPCTRSGQVAPDAPEVEATATVTDDPGEVRRLSRLLTRKYGLLARLFFATDRLPFRTPKQRVSLRLRPVEA